MKFKISMNIDDSCGRIENGIRTYSNEDVIKGVVEIQCLKNVDVKSIVASLHGDMLTMYNPVNPQNSAPARESHAILRTNGLQLFPNGGLSVNSTHTFLQDSVHKYDFELKIPSITGCSCGSDGTLPPTIKYFSDGIIDGSVSYCINIAIRYDGRMLDHTFIFQHHFDFNPTVFENTPISEVNITSNHLFKKKLKHLIDSDAPEKPVAKESPLHNDHRHTRFIRQLFNDNYKNDNYSKLVADVPLNMNIRTRKTLIPSGGPLDELIVTAFVPVQSLQPDFILKSNESSRLGEFHICEFSITLHENTDVRCSPHRDTFRKVYSIYQSKEISAKFDVASFENNSGTFMKVIEDLTKGAQLSLPKMIRPTFSRCGAINKSYIISILMKVKGSNNSSNKYGFSYAIQVGKSPMFINAPLQEPPAPLYTHHSEPNLSYSKSVEQFVAPAMPPVVVSHGVDTGNIEFHEFKRPDGPPPPSYKP